VRGSRTPRPEGSPPNSSRRSSGPPTGACTRSVVETSDPAGLARAPGPSTTSWSTAIPPVSRCLPASSGALSDRLAALFPRGPSARGRPAFWPACPDGSGSTPDRVSRALIDALKGRVETPARHRGQPFPRHADCLDSARSPERPPRGRFRPHRIHAAWAIPLGTHAVEAKSPTRRASRKRARIETVGVTWEKVAHDDEPGLHPPFRASISGSDFGRWVLQIRPGMQGQKRTATAADGPRGRQGCEAVAQRAGESGRQAS